MLETAAVRADFRAEKGTATVDNSERYLISPVGSGHHTLSSSSFRPDTTAGKTESRVAAKHRGTRKFNEISMKFAKLCRREIIDY